MRHDAVVNRSRIAGAARELFAAHGATVPAGEVARLAGVSAATLYRHFPSRAELLDAVLAAEVAACRAELVAASAEPDPWVGLQRMIRGFADQQLRNRALTDLLLDAATGDGALADERAEHSRVLNLLVTRCRDQGTLRDWVTPTYARACLVAIAALRSVTVTDLDALTHTVTDLLLSGLRRPDGPPH